MRREAKKPGFLEWVLRRTVATASCGVQRVQMGPFWTLVETTDGGAGMASTVLAEGPTHGRHAQQMPGAGRLNQLSARELAENVLAELPLARSVGLAALNALLPEEPEGTWRRSSRNASDWLQATAEDAVIGVVGWFPFILQLQAAGRRVEVFEKDSSTGFAVSPERAARLMACDVLCVTAQTLLNGTLEGVLAAARPDALRILTGPGAPVCGAALEWGWNAVCGVRVRQAAAVAEVILQGGCFRQIRQLPEAVELVTLER